MKILPLPRLFAIAGIACPLVLFPVRAAETASGAIVGSVSNAATGNRLEGARVEVSALGLSALTDNTGHFQLPVPAGTHSVVVSYIGLDVTQGEVMVADGQRAVRDFSLTTEIYRLMEFKVTGEREGAAAAITAQRNALNVKNVVAMDSFGNLPNMSASEVAIRLPGVASNLSGSGAGLSDGFTVRGMGPGLNTVTVDGGLISTQNARFRLANINNLTGGMFEQIELIKGHTPDKGADSLGGTVNLKTRSPLSMSEKRRFTYNISLRHAPSFTDQVPLREQHRSHPLVNLGYQEVFSVLGGSRNLGVAVTAFYSENVQGFFRSTREFQNTTDSPAYLWDYRTADNYNNRNHTSVNTKFDYRLSPRTKFTLGTILNDTRENRRRNYEVRAFTTQTVGTSGTAGILPGYTDRVTQVRAAPGSTITMSAPGQGFILRLRGIDFGAEHELDRLQLDYNARYNRSNINQSTGKTGSLIMQVTGVGWILDRTQDDLHPRFTQTEGPDFTNPANYRPAANGLSTTNDHFDFHVTEFRGNARYQLPLAAPAHIKTGALWRKQESRNLSNRYRWNYIGTDPLPADPSIVSLDFRQTGRRMPMWDAGPFMIEGATPASPALWREDVYFHLSDRFLGNQYIAETVTAGYVMADGKLARSGWLGRTGYIAGVRTEKTETESWGWVRARTPSSAAQQQADPFGSVERDYASNRREVEGSYTKSFPSAHLTHDFTRNVKARLSWSTSFGRPSMANFIPSETPNEANRTLTVSNPAVLPQTAQNWDATLEYYFEPVGNVSVGWFRKTIKDYIVSGIEAGVVGTGPDNGYEGEYAGFTRLTTSNAGTAYVQGWEISYQQQFTFLPGLLKGLAFSGNYTWLDTHGDFGGAAHLTSGQVAGFTPHTANVALSWRYRAFSTRVLLNYNGTGITAYNATSPGQNLIRDKRTTTSIGLVYQWRPAISLTLDVDNVFNAPQVHYRYLHDRMQRMVLNGSTLSAGVSGRF